MRLAGPGVPVGPWNQRDQLPQRYHQPRPAASVKPVTHHAFPQRKGAQETTLHQIHQTKIKIALRTDTQRKKKNETDVRIKTQWKNTGRDSAQTRSWRRPPADLYQVHRQNDAREVKKEIGDVRSTMTSIVSGKRRKRRKKGGQHSTFETRRATRHAKQKKQNRQQPKRRATRTVVLHIERRWRIVLAYPVPVVQEPVRDRASAPLSAKPHARRCVVRW